MCDVLIVNSPIFREEVQNYNEDALPPLGLGYIATSLQINQFMVEFIDAFADNLTVFEIHKAISMKMPKFIAINVFTTNFEFVKEIIETCSYVARYIIGGPITKHVYREIVEWETESFVDVVIGDGENIIIDIVKGSLKEHPIYEARKRRVFMVNKDSKYFSKDISNIPLNRSFFKNEPINHPLGFIEATLITSRGCIHDCAFCGAARSLNQEFPIRERTSDSVLDEILYLKEIYPNINSIRVLDDLFLKSIDNIRNAIYIFSKIDLNWRSMAHIKTFNKIPINTLDDLRNSGCNELFIGIESGSSRIQKMINKTNNISLIKDTISRLFLAGINIKSYFIYGFPYETEEDFKATFDLACQIKNLSKDLETRFRVSVFQFRPYHGTKLYNMILAKDGFIKPIEANKELSEHIGRQQFNFQSGNYSMCSNEVLNKYIKLTNNLNNIN